LRKIASISLDFGFHPSRATIISGVLLPPTIQSAIQPTIYLPACLDASVFALG